MFKIKSVTRLAITLGFCCATLIWLAIGMKIIPNPDGMKIENRISLARALAVNVTTMAEKKRLQDLELILDRTVEADPDLVSIGVRRNGKQDYSFCNGAHEDVWLSDQTKTSGAQQIEVDILADGKQWGTLQVTFRKIAERSLASFLAFPIGLIAFFGSAMSLMAWTVLSKAFKYLNPSSVVPDRVKSALDTLAEGLVLIAPTGEIAHANQAFGKITGVTTDDIQGGILSDFEWSAPEAGEDFEFPWEQCRREKAPVCGVIIQLKTGDSMIRKFVVNATPIKGAKDTIRGALVSFDDVTAIENKNEELGKLIHTLRSSRDEVEKQNERLNFLASYDPLTKCMNRRAFFGEFESSWDSTLNGNLWIMMLDVDHFKAVNDNHGHSVGDDVLRFVGELLHSHVGEKGLVCRYGGEEFVVTVPHLTLDEIMELAEAIRAGIESSHDSPVKITASIGISGRHFAAMDAQHMLDQADESLYIAKRHGRNQVVRFDQRADFAELSTDKQEDFTKEIPYSAVSGLLSALSFRCQYTAQHSIRVADLCVAIGQDLMNARELYRLEIAALLHDIGKIGVPDAILNKPSQLTTQEWQLMRKHDQIGVEIVRSAFASDKIAGIIESHYANLAANHGGNRLSTSAEPMPLAAQILTVCDTFDSMTNDRVYRKAMTATVALKEIVENMPQQFTPDIIKRLAEQIQGGLESNQGTSTIVIPASDKHRMSAQIDQLYAAIESQDVVRLRMVVDELKSDATSTQEVSCAAQQLDDAMNTEDGDLEKVLSLANEVLEVCRSHRTTSFMPPVKANTTT